MRRFELHDVDEMGEAGWYMDNQPHKRFIYELKLANSANPILVKNTMKIFDWIRENCPNLNATFPLPHDVYRMRRIVVENGEAVYEVGSWGGGFSNAISKEWSEVYSQRSSQGIPYRLMGIYAIGNKDLEYLLSNWEKVKNDIIAKSAVQSNIFSEEFSA